VTIVSETLSITEAREQLTRLPERFAEHPELGAVALTRRGEPVMAIMPWELYEAITETLEILGDAEQTALLRQSIEDLAAGRTRAWDDIKAELGL
jgi:PHD/YefM family antitoxin component YafN of YafNO toxin-antitoxin module